uniref:DNA replication complex GINS protein PSF3 n=1 Tax=Angiostrongylus cantonensis TaxID=6313 RepID=A0A0K0DFL3_ANGCA
MKISSVQCYSIQRCKFHKDFDVPVMASNESDVAADFFDIDSLLARSTKVMCTYNSSTPRVLFQMALPMAYNSNVRNVLLANAAHANLDSLQPYYYEMGMSLCHLVSGNIGSEIADCLLETIVQRIGSKTNSIVTVCGTEITSKSDNMEKRLYEEGMKCRSRLHEYFSAQQVTKGRKRRL